MSDYKLHFTVVWYMVVKPYHAAFGDCHAQNTARKEGKKERKKKDFVGEFTHYAYSHFTVGATI
jgi:hypothetical protein